MIKTCIYCYCLVTEDNFRQHLNKMHPLAEIAPGGYGFDPMSEHYA